MIKKKSREGNKNAKERRKSEDRKVKGTIIKEWQSDEARKLRTGMSILRAASNNRVVMHAAYMSLVELKLIAQITRNENISHCSISVTSKPVAVSAGLYYVHKNIPQNSTPPNRYKRFREGCRRDFRSRRYCRKYAALPR